MGISLLVAKKFIKSKNKKTFINFLSLISTITIIIGTASMIIVLSVFNGLEDVLKSIYAEFDPEIKIESKLNRDFKQTNYSEISKIKNVKTITGVLENKGLITLDDNQIVSNIKGVDLSFV
jgi:lipoprotein-releasing system permease protein